MLLSGVLPARTEPAQQVGFGQASGALLGGQSATCLSRHSGRMIRPPGSGRKLCWSLIEMPMPMQARLAECARLAEEMGVQAAAIEAARANVEHHYAYICTHFQTFMDR